MSVLPPLYNCEVCGRGIDRLEKDIYVQIKGWARITARGNIDQQTLLSEKIGGVACKTCIQLRVRGYLVEPDTLF